MYTFFGLILKCSPSLPLIFKLRLTPDLFSNPTLVSDLFQNAHLTVHLFPNIPPSTLPGTSSKEKYHISLHTSSPTLQLTSIGSPSYSPSPHATPPSISSNRHHRYRIPQYLHITSHKSPSSTYPSIPLPHPSSIPHRDAKSASLTPPTLQSPVSQKHGISRN